MSRTATRAHHYLPNFGSFAMAARFLIFAELLAIIITIGRNHIFDEQAWQELSLLSAFALTIAFCSIVVLKLASPLLRRLPPALGSTAGVVLLLAGSAPGAGAWVGPGSCCCCSRSPPRARRRSSSPSTICTSSPSAGRRGATRCSCAA